MPLSLRLLIVLVLVLSTISSLIAQSASSATISGTVADNSGAVVPGASVKLIDLATASARALETNSAGQYTFVGLPPGSYKLTVSAPSFRQSVLSFKTEIAKAYTVNITLEVGEVSQSVEVSAAGVELQTFDATVGNVIQGESMLRLPNINRSALVYYSLQPLTMPTYTGLGSNNAGQVAGARSDQTSFAVDGVDATDNIVGNGGGPDKGGVIGAAVPVPSESIEEFRVATTNPNASYGRASGGQFAFVTKRGTNTLHGSLYEYLQNDNLNANTWTRNRTGIRKPELKDNRFGGSVGGPIWKDHTFVYANYEGRRFPQASDITRLVPRDSLKQGILRFRDASGVTREYAIGTSTACGAGGGSACDPRSLGLNPLVSAVWNKLPAGNDPSLGDGLNTIGFRSPADATSVSDTIVTRLDHNFSANWRFNAVTRFSDATSRNNSQVDIGGLLPGDTTGQAITTRQSLYKARSYIAALNGVITTALTNELRAGFVRSWTWSPTVSPFPQVPGTNAALSITGNSGYGGLVDVPAKRRRGADWPPRHTPWRRSAPIAVVRLGDRDGPADDVVERVAAAVSLVALHHRDRQAAVRDEDASDRKGQNNLWLMDPDGSNPTAVYVNQEVRVSEPAWTPDGEYIVVNRPDMRRTDSGRQGQTGIWMYSWRGGDGVQLVGRDVKRPGNPSVSPDGKHVYYHMMLGPDPPALTDLIKGSFQLRRLDRITGETLEITDDIADRLIRGSSGGALAPEISPDNRWLAFTRRIPNATLSFKGHKYGPRNALWLRDLKLGTERVLMDPVETDSSEGSYSLRVMPGYSWARDGKSLVAAAGGKLRRVYTEDGHVETIPFTARVHRTISEMAYAPFRISDGPFQVKFARWHTASPDGRTLAFQAVGKIYTMTLPDGAPKRLTPDTFKPLEYTPAWSPDGQWIAFTTRDEKEHGFLWKVRAGGGSPEQLVSDSGE